MGEKDIENAPRTNTKVGEMDPRKMKAGSMLMSGESFTACAKLLPLKKSLEWKAQLCSTASISDQGRLEHNKRKV